MFRPTPQRLAVSARRVVVVHALTIVVTNTAFGSVLMFQIVFFADITKLNCLFPFHAVLFVQRTHKLLDS